MQATVLFYAFLAGLLPALIWLWFWTREDENKEPKWMLALAFFGGIISVIFAIFAEKYVSELVISKTTHYILWATIEEVFKFVAVIAIALNSGYNDEPIDAMIYSIVVALGFSAFENALFLLQPLSGGEYLQSFITGNLRFVGATLVHVVCSAVVGFSFGLVFYKGIIQKIIAVSVGLLTAIVLHSAFNLSIINAGTADTLKVFTWVWVAVIILIVLFEEVKTIKPKVSYNN